MRLPTNQGFRGGLEYKAYEANFNPALGFINRSNISNAEANLGYMLRPASGYVQSLLMVCMCSTSIGSIRARCKRMG